MAHRQPELPVSLAGHAVPFIAVMDDMGAQWRRSLGHARLPSEIVDPLEWWPTANLARFIDDVSRREHIPDLGVIVGCSDYSGTVHPRLQQRIQWAPTLYRALREISIHCSLQGSHLRIWLHASGNRLLLRHGGSMSAASPGAVQTEHLRVVQLLKVIRRFLGPGWQPDWLALAAPQTPPGSLQDCVGDAPIRTGRPFGEIPIPLSRIGSAAPGASWTPTDETPALADASGAPDDWLLRLKAVALSYLPSGGLNLNQVAEIAGVRPRTLQRLLAGHHTSYQRLLDLARFERASDLLANSDMPIVQVARRTGYSDPANFRRAFRRVSGRTPAQYRQEQSPAGAK